MVAFCCPWALPSTCSVYLPGLVLRLTPAIAYQHLQPAPKRKVSSCPRKLPVISLILAGVVTWKSTGDPFTTRAGSHWALHDGTGGRAYAESPVMSARRTMVAS